MKPQPGLDGQTGNLGQFGVPIARNPYGAPKDRLWVKETWMDLHGTGVQYRNQANQPQRYAYAADAIPGSALADIKSAYGLKWRPSIFMPRAASRLTLEIESVRPQRLQDIDVADSQAEGVDKTAATYRDAYAALWDTINGRGDWDTNPWVWVVEFKRVE